MPAPDNAPAFYAALVESVEAGADREALARLFAQARGAAGGMAAAATPAVLRWLARFGCDGAPAWIAGLPEATGRDPGQLALVLRLFAEGIDGLMPAVCGAAPRCARCRLTRDCAWYNAPRAGSRSRLPPGRCLLREGAAALGDSELLVVLLDGDRGGEETRGRAERLLARYGGLRALAAAPAAELAGLQGISEAAAVRIAAAAEFARRMLAERRAVGPAVRSARDFYDLYGPRLRDLRQEVFWAVLLDQKHRILREIEISRGTLTASLVHPREAFAPAMRESAAAVAFLHNHPSGDPAPSREDRELTRRLAETSRLVGIPILDHVIVGEGGYASLAEEGAL